MHHEYYSKQRHDLLAYEFNDFSKHVFVHKFMSFNQPEKCDKITDVNEFYRDNQTRFFFAISETFIFQYKYI